MMAIKDKDIKTMTISQYRSLLVNEMLKMGATDEDLLLIKDATIRNAIKKERKPEDVAWAILQ